MEVILISHNHGTTTVALPWICKFICMSLCNGCVFNRDWRDWAEIFCCHQLCIKLMIFCRMQWWRCPHQTSKGIHLGEMRCHRTVSKMVRIQYTVEEWPQEVNHRTYCTVPVWPFRCRMSLDQTCSSLLIHTAVLRLVTSLWKFCFGSSRNPWLRTQAWSSDVERWEGRRELGMPSL